MIYLKIRESAKGKMILEFSNKKSKNINLKINLFI